MSNDNKRSAKAPMVSIYEGLARILRSRWSDHQEADRSLILNKCINESGDPLFFYGIAHVLKHYARMKASKLLSFKADARKREDALDLALTVGWADEFYWLAQWSQSGVLSGRPDYKTIKNAEELLYFGLLRAEWGDLLQDAWFYYRQKLIFLDSNNLDITRYVNQFEIYKAADYSNDRENAFFFRAKDRFEHAGEVMRYLKKKFKKEVKMRLLDEAIKDTQKIVDYGLARIYHAHKDIDHSLTFFNKALINEEVITEKLKKLTTRIKNRAIVDLDLEIKKLMDKERESHFSALHFLAGWIKDLLGDNTQVMLHPRLALPKKPPGSGSNIRNGTPVTSFPNLDTISMLNNQIKRHLGWLGFVTDESMSKDFIEKLETIIHSDEELKKLVIDESHSPEKPLDTEWQLYVLRDWGSYTPLLPNEMKGGNGNNEGGGGYFLRHKKLGIVIDPGFDYIDHFYGANLSLEMITHVVVTHDHYDHVTSFGPLLDLLHRHHRCHARNKKRNVNFLLSRGVFDQYARFIVDFEYFGKVEPITEHDEERGRIHVLSVEDDVKLYTTQTQHGDENGFGRGVGLVFKFAAGFPMIGITSDTGWFDSFQKKRGKTIEMSLGKIFYRFKPKVMILHVGSLKKEELVNSGFYKTHLGARGVFRCIDEIKSCRLALLSEFGEECRKHRTWFANKITEHFSKLTDRKFSKCFPTDHKTRIVGKQNGALSLVDQKDDNWHKHLIPCEQAAVEDDCWLRFFEINHSP